MILVINWLSRIFLVFICLNSVFLDSLDIWMHSTQNVFRVQNILASGKDTNISGHLQGNTSFNSRLQKYRATKSCTGPWLWLWICDAAALDLNVIKATMGGMLHLASHCSQSSHNTWHWQGVVSWGAEAEKAEYWTHKEFSIQFSWSETFYPTWKDLRLQLT